MSWWGINLAIMESRGLAGVTVSYWKLCASGRRDAAAYEGPSNCYL